MAFSRVLDPPSRPEPDVLTSDMVGIGMGFASPSGLEPNIEDTLFFASLAAMEEDDLRVLAILTTWFGVHHAWVNADRLIRIVGSCESARVRALWAALSSWQRSDHRFARMHALHKGPRIDVLATGTEFQLRRHGEDPRFEGTPIRAPANVLRDRPADVLDPADLARRHRAYRYRVMIGPSYRADAWAALEAKPDLSATALARAAYASFATAWNVKREYAIVTAARHRPRSLQTW